MLFQVLSISVPKYTLILLLGFKRFLIGQDLADIRYILFYICVIHLFHHIYLNSGFQGFVHDVVLNV